MADARTETEPLQVDQADLNAAFWKRGDQVAYYATTGLRPVEEVLLERYRDALGGSVLELGCGAGRLTGHLIERAGAVLGVDISPAMVAHCRERYPGATFAVGDLLELSAFAGAAHDVVVAPFNVLDVLDDPERKSVLRQIGSLLAVDGLLIMSSHNRAYASRIGTWPRVLLGSPRHPAQSLRTLPRRLANHRRLAPLQREERDYAIRNDEAHDFAVLHYYTTRDAQERQLAEHGYALVECLDLDGQSVGRGEAARHCSELHYVARR